MATNGIDVVANVKLFDLDAALNNNSPVPDKQFTWTINGTTSDDIVNITGNGTMGATINTAEGNDTVRAANSKAAISVNTGTGKDWVDGSAYNDTIILGDGNDTTYAGAGNDYIDGGAGSDYLSAGEGNDTVIGGSGRDYLEGSRGDDELWGNDASNVDDNERDNFIYRLDRTLKNNKVNLGLEWGNDTIHDFHAHSNDKKGDLIEMDDFFMRLSDVDVKKILDAVDNAVTLKDSKFYDDEGNVFKNGTAKQRFKDAHTSSVTGEGELGVNDAPKETIYKFNGLDNGNYEVTISANWNSSTDHVSMTLGFRNADENAHDDGATITIENADDLNAVASFDRETMKLVHGKDDAADGDGINMMNDDYRIALEGKGAYFYGFKGNDNVIGTLKDDNLGGGDGNDTISGEAGNDRVYGDAGNDILMGGAGNDYLSGGADNDRLYGDAGNDTLWGGTGTNFLTGGAEKDIFFFNGSGLTFANDGHAIAKLESTKTIITDFTVLADKIKLGDVFADYRISNTNAQNAKYAEWLSSHISVEDRAGKLDLNQQIIAEGDGKKDLIIHLSTNDTTDAGYNDNVVIVMGNDNFDAQNVYNTLKAGNVQSMMDFFVFG